MIKLQVRLIRLIYLIEGIDLFSGVQKCVIKDVIEYQTSAGKIKNMYNKESRNDFM